MPKSKPLFLVEGHLEKEFLHDICDGKSKVLKIPNGKTVSPAAIAKQAYSLIKATNIEPSYVIIIADREQRNETSHQIEKEVSDNLKQSGMLIPFSVHVPDKMIENWILADQNLLVSEGLNINAANYEGFHGKSELDKAYKNKKLNYKERIDGVRLLKAASANSIKANSASFARLFDTLNPIMNTCFWLKK